MEHKDKSYEFQWMSLRLNAKLSMAGTDWTSRVAEGIPERADAADETRHLMTSKVNW
jgi:hypothetical protein